MTSVADALGALVADLEPDTLLGADAASLYVDFARLERLVGAAKTLLAPRIADSGHWEAQGHRSAAGLLATLEGGSAGQAKRTLETGRQLAGLPSVEHALRQGRLSGPKAAEITDAATLDPGAETLLLAGSDDETLSATKERCQRVVVTSARHDPLAASQRVHARRSFRHWTGADGAFCYQGSDTPERGAALVARLVPAATRLAEARRAAATRATTSSPSSPAPVDSPSDTAAARLADALFLLVTGGMPIASATRPDTSRPDTSRPDTSRPDTCSPDGSDAHGSSPDASDAHGSDADAGLATSGHLIDRPAPATVMVRVDLEALRRGHALPGELCDLDGQGPIPVPLARSLAVDSFLAVVFTEAGDIRSVSHLGRTINQRLRTALCFRDRTCVVPGCAMPYGLEIDHLDPWALGGATELGNLAVA